MKLLAIAAVILASATAYAQAPGETPVAPPPAPEASPCGCTAQIPVMANRWAVGFSAGQLSVAPKDAPDNQMKFAIGELSLRFRATYHLEIELALGGGSEKLNDGQDGQNRVSTALLGLRYRFAADRHWNWWLGGGLGAITIADVGATDQQRQDAQRPMGALAIGLERRWSQFALHAELRGFGVGQRNDQQAMPVAVSTPAGTTMQPPPPTSPASPASPDLSGGIVTLGASYYF